MAHISRCQRCGRRLKDPLAISIGYGPACALNRSAPPGKLPRPAPGSREEKAALVRRAKAARARAHLKNVLGPNGAVLFADEDAALIADAKKDAVS